MAIPDDTATPAASSLTGSKSSSSTEKIPNEEDFHDTKGKTDVESLDATDEDVDSVVIKKDEDVAVEVLVLVEHSFTRCSSSPCRSSPSMTIPLCLYSHSGRCSWASASRRLHPC